MINHTYLSQGQYLLNKRCVCVNENEDCFEPKCTIFYFRKTFHFTFSVDLNGGRDIWWKNKETTLTWS